MKKLLLVVLLALCIMVSPVLAATISTDKQDYSPEQVVTILGTGFTPGAPVYITVTRPISDPTDPSVTPYPVYADASGAFDSVTYQLDGMSGTYTVDARDSAGNVIAQTTFKDTVLIPEFPSMALPAGMMIGLLGLVFVIRSREK